jgi:hypothetical protein
VLTSGDEYTTEEYYIPIWNYQYEIEGQSYLSERQLIGEPKKYNTQKIAEAKLEKRPVGSVVRVYYNPEDPSRAVLTPGAQNTGSWLLASMVITFMVLVFLAFALAIAFSP